MKNNHLMQTRRSLSDMAFDLEAAAQRARKAADCIIVEMIMDGAEVSKCYDSEEGTMYFIEVTSKGETRVEDFSPATDDLSSFLFEYDADWVDTEEAGYLRLVLSGPALADLKAMFDDEEEDEDEEDDSPC